MSDNTGAAGVLVGAMLAKSETVNRAGLIAEADYLIEALKLTGRVVVNLPEPDSTRYEGGEFPPADRSAWATGGKFAVSHWEYPEVQIAYDDEPFEPISIDEARRFAAALLAAANAAEAQS